MYVSYILVFVSFGRVYLCFFCILLKESKLNKILVLIKEIMMSDVF